MNTTRCNFKLFTFDDLVFVLVLLGASACSRLKRYSQQRKHDLEYNYLENEEDQPKENIRNENT